MGVYVVSPVGFYPGSHKSGTTFDTIGTDGKKYDSELVHQISLASLKDEFATILTSDELLEVL